MATPPNLWMLIMHAANPKTAGVSGQLSTAVVAVHAKRRQTTSRVEMHQEYVLHPQFCIAADAVTTCNAHILS